MNIKSKAIIILAAAGFSLTGISSASAKRCKDVLFVITNEIGSTIRVNKVRYRDFNDSKVRTTNFANLAIGGANQPNNSSGLTINLKNVRNEQVGEFEFEYQVRTGTQLFGSSWGPRRWTTRQGNIESCNTGDTVSISVPN